MSRPEDVVREALPCTEPISVAIGESCGECQNCEARAALDELVRERDEWHTEQQKTLAAWQPEYTGRLAAERERDEAEREWKAENEELAIALNEEHVKLFAAEQERDEAAEAQSRVEAFAARCEGRAFAAGTRAEAAEARVQELETALGRAVSE